jgi:predicted nucleic acid-binding protein
MSSNTQKKNWKKRELFLDFSIVLNSSPTIILLNSGREDLLKKLFKRILLPEAVLEEVTKQKDRAGLLLPELSWIEIVKTEIISDVALWNIGKGESEVISYVKSNSSLVAVIDDASARKCAETIDIQ